MMVVVFFFFARRILINGKESSMISFINQAFHGLNNLVGISNYTTINRKSSDGRKLILA
jgi:hypothetical protein